MTLRILVVEDEAYFRQALRDVLRQLGHDVGEASDGREAVAEMAATAFDVVITDIFMPEKDGLETIMEIRSRFPKVGIIAMSGGGIGTAADVLQLATHLGADVVLRKPFDRAHLIEALASWRKRSGA
jgi:CheY-like chemotaxis protein